MLRVGICICTCQRNRELKRLIESLGKLAFVKNERPELKIVVVDNEPDQRNRELCEAFNLRDGLEILYGEERTPGISHARNKALSLVGSEKDAVVFIDDDEEASPQWLDEIIGTQRRYNADVVAGAVIYRFEEKAPQWIVKGGFIQYPRYETGTIRGEAATNNVLITRKVLDEINFRFDERFDLRGGGDKHFFRKIVEQGYKIVWSDDAVTYEWVSAERATGRWLCQRFFRNGNSASLLQNDKHGKLVGSLRNLFLGWGYLFFGGLYMAFSWLQGWPLFVNGLRKFFYGLGTLAALCGIRYEEYKRSASL